MELRRRLVVKPGAKVALSRYDPRNTCGFKSKAAAQKEVRANASRLADLQYLLYAESKRALLIVLQGMDAAGKDGTIRHVMSALNPQGCAVTPFKVPSAEEYAHDFLWRIHKAVPKRGEIGIFNRSHYEDVLAARVRKVVPRSVWSRRYEQINSFEKMLVENDVVILKFFLHISEDEQKARLERRLRDPKRMWKASPADFEERKLWADYVNAYEEALGRCSTEHAPWHIIPADHKWFRNLAVSSIMREALEGLHMEFPAPTFDLSTVSIE
jgi:PPK2 family polyphosphate:nucleotide phosphotransferase